MLVRMEIPRSRDILMKKYIIIQITLRVSTWGLIFKLTAKFEPSKLKILLPVLKTICLSFLKWFRMKEQIEKYWNNNFKFRNKITTYLKEQVMKSEDLMTQLEVRRNYVRKVSQLFSRCWRILFLESKVRSKKRKNKESKVKKVY